MDDGGGRVHEILYSVGQFVSQIVYTFHFSSWFAPSTGLPFGMRASSNLPLRIVCWIPRTIIKFADGDRCTYGHGQTCWKENILLEKASAAGRTVWIVCPDLLGAFELCTGQHSWQLHMTKMFPNIAFMTNKFKRS